MGLPERGHDRLLAVAKVVDGRECYVVERIRTDAEVKPPGEWMPDGFVDEQELERIRLRTAFLAFIESGATGDFVQRADLDVMAWAIGLCLERSPGWPIEARQRASWMLRDIFLRLGNRDIVRLQSQSLWFRRVFAGYACDVESDEEYALPDLRFSDFAQDVVCYIAWGAVSPLPLKTFKVASEHFEELWGGPVEFVPGGRLGAVPGSVVVRRADPAALALTGTTVLAPTVSLPREIPLTPSPCHEIILGTDIFSGEVVSLPVAKLSHTLVVGAAGFGKSVFIHQLVSQLVDHPETERMYLVDLKGGVEFAAYEGREKARVIWKMEEVRDVVSELVAAMAERYDEMRAKRLPEGTARGNRSYRGGRIFFVVDEFAQLELYTPQDSEKAAHRAFKANLARLSMQSRAAGVVLIAGTQRATQDSMSGEFRYNLTCQVCFRVPLKQTAALMFGSTEGMRVDPLRLERGQFILSDRNLSEIRYLKAHIAPEARDDETG